MQIAKKKKNVIHYEISYAIKKKNVIHHGVVYEIKNKTRNEKKSVRGFFHNVTPSHLLAYESICEKKKKKRELVNPSRW